MHTIFWDIGGVGLLAHGRGAWSGHCRPVILLNSTFIVLC